MTTKQQYIEKLRLDAEHWAAKRDELTDRNQKHAARIRQEMCLQHANELEAMDVAWVPSDLAHHFAYPGPYEGMPTDDEHRARMKAIIAENTND